MARPYVVGIGGTTRTGSSTERALALCLQEVVAQGAEARLISGRELELPPYSPGKPLPAVARQFVDEIRRADGVILGTPGYHGGISGLVKNAIDYFEELKDDQRPYLEGRAVGCVVTAAGDQGAVATLLALRSVVHALRGWPTPLGVAIVASGNSFDVSGRCSSGKIDSQLKTLARQVLDFTHDRRLIRNVE